MWDQIIYVWSLKSKILGCRGKGWYELNFRLICSICSISKMLILLLDSLKKETSFLRKTNCYYYKDLFTHKDIKTGFQKEKRKICKIMHK